jgi:hypothetical protein
MVSADDQVILVTIEKIYKKVYMSTPNNTVVRSNFKISAEKQKY